MKIFYSEFNRDYTSYTFSYAVYALMDDPEELPAIYDLGFLPFSNDIEDDREIFYLARSLRVNTELFTDSSENRRVDRKLAPLDIRVELLDAAIFDFNDPAFRSFCLTYAAERFGQAMPESRFDYITRRRILSHILRFTAADGKIAGYVFCLIKKNMFHYWFSFFDLEWMKSFPLGKWMMWKSIKWAGENKLTHIYLGTCYGEKALYKVRDFNALSFYDGQVWNEDRDLLKKWAKEDHQILPADRHKLGIGLL